MYKTNKSKLHVELLTEWQCASCCIVLTKFLKLPQPSDLIKLLTELVGDGFNNFILGEVSELNKDEIDTFDDKNNVELTEVRRAGWLGF